MIGAFAGSGAVTSAGFAETEESSVVAESDTAERVGVLYQAKEGTWGRLQYYYFYLEAPSHLVDAFPLRNPRTRWAVPLDRQESIRTLISTTPMAPEHRTALLDVDNSGEADGLFAIFPPAEVLLNLNPEARSILYDYLGTYPFNPDIKDPVRILSGSVDEWAAGTSIRPEIIEVMKKMVFHRAGLMLFADFPYLISMANSEEEIRTLQRHSSRVRSMVLRLDLGSEAEIDGVLGYWTTGLGLRRKEVESLIQSSMLTPGVPGLDIVHLLPPLPRKLLYTYPDLSMAMDGVMPDCHWTALNFYNYNPEPIYLDEFFAASSLLTGFERVDAPYSYGDVLVYVTEKATAHHSCVYLADNIVYTKNGRSIYAPWTIAHLADISSLYFEADGLPLSIQGYRKKA
jgi:hypothetical protein